MQASEGVGPYGEVEYRYRRHYGAAFVQDDIKLTPRLTLNLGLRWEYIGPSLDTAGTIGNVWPSLLRQARDSAGLRARSSGNTVAANYDPNLVNPYTGKPFGPPPDGVLVRSDEQLLPATARRATPSRRAPASPGSPSARRAGWSCGGGYGWFYQTPSFSGNAGALRCSPRRRSPRASPIRTPATVVSNFAEAVSGHHARLCPAHAHFATLRPRGRTGYRIPGSSSGTSPPSSELRRRLSLDLGYVGSHGDRLLLSRGLNQPLLASAGIRSTAATTAFRRTASPRTRRRTRSSACRSWAKRPPRCRPASSPGAPGITACRRPCASRSRAA